MRRGHTFIARTRLEVRPKAVDLEVLLDCANLAHSVGIAFASETISWQPLNDKEVEAVVAWGEAAIRVPSNENTRKPAREQCYQLGSSGARQPLDLL